MSTIKTVEVACSQCGASSTSPVWSGREHEYEGTTDAEFKFVKCDECELVRLNPRPDVSELPRIYPSDYYAYNLVSDDLDEPVSRTDRMKMRVFQRRFLSVVERLGKQGPIRILDVGCADGRLLDWYKRSSVGDRLETHGIEMSDSAADIARRRGHRVVTGRFEVDDELEPGSFDLILASHVIEHVDDPRRFAERAAELLAPNGLFVVGTPNWDSPDARRFAGNWGGNHFPRHWTLFDEGSLARMATAVGLEVELVEYQPNPIFWVWTWHSLLRQRFPQRQWPDRLFPPVEVFTPSLRSFLLLSLFTVQDTIMKAVAGRTASMDVEMRKR